MEPLYLPGTKSTPEISFDPATGVLAMSGESYPENSYEFYKPVISWLSRFIVSHAGPIAFNVHLSYLNTGSTKCMMDLLDLLEESFLTGKDIQVNWLCDRENDRALENAEEFREEISLPFHIRPVSEAP
jgi:hypothetical protein